MNMKENPSAKLTLSVAEAAKLMGIDKNKVYELAKTPDFPAVRLDGRVLILPEELKEWLRRKAGR